ncbi:hypothetical protein THIX_60983 [Thiomonas sp. X19]|uniref:hypothetical protein n=1 Tax=Thiomonas sp. X19 TaxID=1050370 RepID=UPI000B68E65E|nr:hypothetical protein [Thiomonas sp. X19]SCC94925.1 hypothetical protein THIX_60983 [Thiomonas sp. X19]
MFSKHKTETSPVAKTMGSAAKVVAAGIGGEAAVLAVSAMGRLLKIFGTGRVKSQKESAPQATHQRGAKIEDLRD